VSADAPVLLSKAKLPRGFFERDPLTCARELIGCELFWNECAGIVVETEAYAAKNDEACHTFMRPSARNFIATHDAGAAYVYLNYGMHWLLNVLVKNGGEDGFVLLRALQPTRGVETMASRRMSALKKGYSLRALCSGPGKLSQALEVRRADHGRDLCSGKLVGFLPPHGPVRVTAALRIGISKAAHLPWRFLLRGSEFVSAKADTSPRKPKPAAPGVRPLKTKKARPL
jgi:DNA-3-methyladenine glycosylase